LKGLVFVGDRCCDHSLSSGYDQVCSLFPDAGWLGGRALEAGRIEWFRHPEPPTQASPRILHVIYGDCSGKSLPELLRRRFPNALIVSSVHQPIVRLRADPAACKALSASNAIVTVSNEQARELEELGLEVPIHAVPHGVWTGVFRPRSRWRHYSRQDVLLVGSFLRDWAGAKRVVAELARIGVRSIALGAGALKHLAGNDSLVSVPPRVTEAELAELYDRSAVLFLPFVEATASNALLEAMAAGCPVVCPRLPALVEEYLGDDLDSFDAGRYDIAVERILHYIRHQSDRESRRSVLMTRAYALDWSRVKPRLAWAYEHLAAIAPC
jgi:glycosyltransferase involved in cell wall biosynthesis